MGFSTIFIIALGLVFLIGLFFIAQKTFLRRFKLRDAAEAFEQKHFLKAKNILNTLVEKEPRNTLFLWYLGRAEIELGSVNKGVSHLKKIAGINRFPEKDLDLPERGNFSEIGVHRYLRDVFRRAHRDEEVFTENQILMRLDPQNAEYPFEIARTMLKQREFSERSLNFLRQALSIERENADAFALLAWYYLYTEDLGLARKHSENALGLHAEQHEARYVLGEVCKQVSEPDHAEMHLLEGVKSDIFGRTAALALADHYYQQDSLDQAMVWVKRAEEKATTSFEEPELEWEVKYLHALILEKQNKPKEAHSIYQHISQFRNDFKDVNVRLNKTKNNQSKEYIKDFITAKNDIFAIICEDLVAKLNYTVKNVQSTEDGNINLIVKTKDISPRQIAVFVRRTHDLISEEVLTRLIKFTRSTNSHEGLLITSGHLTSTSRNAAKKANIKLIEADQLETMLGNLNKK